MSKTVQIEDKYKTYDQFSKALKQSGIESMQLVVGFDFSKSNEWQGENSYNQSLHCINEKNPYIHILKVLQPIIEKFDDDGIIPAYRFGCFKTRDQTVLPLNYPDNQSSDFNGIKEVIDNYVSAVKSVKLYGPTTFAPMIYKTIEIVQQYKKEGFNQLVVLILMTDGDVSNLQLDCQAICQASNYPISIVAIGLGDGPFDKMVLFDDMEGNRKFDNFQFVNFTTMQHQLRKHPNPELVLATAIFNELPDQYQEMIKLGLQ